jgi:hypothetical protein
MVTSLQYFVLRYRYLFADKWVGRHAVWHVQCSIYVLADHGWYPAQVLAYIVRYYLSQILDDVCVYRRALEQHLRHFRLVLVLVKKFNEEGLKLRNTKCFFGLQEMEFLCYIVSGSKLSVSTLKVNVVRG